jgi:hypothetical protein
MDQMMTSRRRSPRQEIEGLDPRTDHQRIVHLLACYEFPWDMTRSLELALLRTFCSPAVSKLLAETREFLDRPQKRYDDTDIIVSELVEYGYDHERGKTALRRMNQIHGRFDIENEDFLYVLSTFIFEPIRWFDRFGWRKPTENERLAIFYFWREVGRRMGIREIPESIEEFERFNVDYEDKLFDFDKRNQEVAESTMEMMAGWFPGIIRPFVRISLTGMLDETMCRCFGFRRPPWVVRGLLGFSLRLRGQVLRILPYRSRPRLRTEGGHRTYPEGYCLEEIGPEF